MSVLMDSDESREQTLSPHPAKIQKLHRGVDIHSQEQLSAVVDETPTRGLSREPSLPVANDNDSSETVGLKMKGVQGKNKGLSGYYDPQSSEVVLLSSKSGSNDKVTVSNQDVIVLKSDASGSVGDTSLLKEKANADSTSRVSVGSHEGSHPSIIAPSNSQILLIDSDSSGESDYGTPKEHITVSDSESNNNVTSTGDQEIILVDAESNSGLVSAESANISSSNDVDRSSDRDQSGDNYSDSSSDSLSDDSDSGDEYISREATSMARSFLKENGSMKFLEKYLPETLSSEDISSLVKLLGFRPTLLHIRDEQEKMMFLIKFLQRAMNKVMTMRVRLPNYNTIDSFVSALQKSSKIMVLTGAGISTSLGIPDFRSSIGFYSQLGHLGLQDPQEVFDLQIFREDPSIFYSIAHLILPPEHSFTPLHAFIKVLQDKGKLLRNYTQNIDNLESNVGILEENLIQCHGSFAKLTCVTCGYKVPGNTIFPELKRQELAICPWCKSKRNKLEDEVEGAYGVMKPDITFFGELLPERFHDTITNDIHDCDLLICIGTSLKVAPVANIVNMIPPHVPQILINKDPVSHCEFDLSLLGYCDQVISLVCSKLGWKLNHQDYDKILSNGLDCKPIEPAIGVYEITENLPLPAKQEESPAQIATTLLSSL